jgi:hypothetical protein
MEELQKTTLPSGMYIQRNDHNRIIIYNNSIVVFTPTEYRLFCLLLEGTIIDDATIADKILSSEINQATKNLLKKHIENMKSKLHTVGLDIYRVHKKGYILMAS